MIYRNSHLNLFKTYTKKNRERQLENDLTRALAVTLLENNLFLHEILKFILQKNQGYYNNTFDDFSGKNEIQIDIQKTVSELAEFEHLFAVSVTGSEMDTTTFFEQSHNVMYDAITDLVITIHNVAIIFEVKPNNVDCTTQLYNQAYNAFNQFISKDNVTPVDLNWKILMQLAVRVNNFEVAINKPSRVMFDFIYFIKGHDYSWLPVLSLSALTFNGNTNSISDRLADAIDKSQYERTNSRLGIKYNLGWGKEILVYIMEQDEQIRFSVYPGNTRNQGRELFKTEGEPEFKTSLRVLGKDRKVDKKYHIKFSAFSSFFTGLLATENDLKENLYSKKNFRDYTGRKKRNDNNWQEIEKLFDTCFKPEYNWKRECRWETKIINSNRTQFDMSFGYEVNFSISYKELQDIDIDKNDLNQLILLLEEVKTEFQDIVVK